MQTKAAAVRIATSFVLLLGVALCASPAQALPFARAAHATSIRPWVEGVDPALEDALFKVTYRALPAHNVLKVYAFAAGGYESAGVRFSARVPHQARDLTTAEIAHEAATLIRVAFDNFPDIEEVDVWGTIPVSVNQAKSIENTVFSVAASREIYMQLERQAALSDESFVGAFGRVWISPQVPR